ncbi:MAG: hypothetical protein ACI8SJ_001648 [Shewanella sp.]
MSYLVNKYFDIYRNDYRDECQSEGEMFAEMTILSAL